MDKPKKPEQPDVEVHAPQPVTTSEPSQVRRRNWIEVLVDPKTLQGLMTCGGGLLVLGLVVWLWSIGVFENKLIVATCLGVANVGLLAVGVSSAKYSRYQTAGKAITMLACLVMPLNLWFYDAQGLITLDQGGHLWVPALACCALYVFVARLLADPLYVNAIVGGVAMTGLLFLADDQVGRFWEIMAPSTFLVVLGMVCIHAERAFPLEAGPFSRANFGRAFFHAGHFVMGIGLAVLLVGRLVGRLYEPFLTSWDWVSLPAVATDGNLKLLALALALGAAYSYVYSQIVVQAKGRYLVSAVLTLIWSAIILLDLLQVAFTMELVMLLASLGALLTSAALFSAKQPEASQDGSSGLGAIIAPLWQTSSGLAIALNLATLGLGLALYVRARLEMIHAVMPYSFNGMYVLAAIIGGAACWLAARSIHRTGETKFGVFLGQACVVLAWLAVDAAIVSLGFGLSVASLAVVMLVPLTLSAITIWSNEKTAKFPQALTAETLATLMLTIGMGSALGLVRNVAVMQPHLWLTIFFIEAAICFGLSSRITSRLVPAVLAAVSICGATWQLFLMLGVTQHVFIYAMTLIGMVCLCASSVLNSDDNESSQFAVVGNWTGRLCISIASVAVLLISLARLLTGEASSSVLVLLVVQTSAGALAGLLSSEAVWRRHFWVLASGLLLMTMLVVNALSPLSFWQRSEVLLTACGLLILAFGYAGWYREVDREEDWVSFNLALGSLLSAGPLTFGMLVQRFDSKIAEWGWVLVHEAGVLVVGLLLLGAGVLCRIRWSTIVGGATLLIYVVSLVGLVRLPEQLQTTAIYMMVGGGLFFGTAVLLSVYRDRLLAIPKRVQEGEGVFRVLKWR